MTPAITVDELKNILAENPSYFVLDVRQPEEISEGVVSGSTMIPLGELPGRLAELESKRGENFVVHCRSGARSERAVQYLNSLGFDTVNLLGGIREWCKE